MFSLVNLSFAHIVDCDFSDRDLQDSLLVPIKTGEKSSQGSRFCRANFTRAQVRRCEFQSCDFTKALLENVDLRDSVFRNCIFLNASFIESDLRGAVFQDCDLHGADFNGLNLTVCKMINCTGGPDKPLENLLLAAVSNGIDSLWMCDVLYAYQEYQDCLKLREPLVAYVALGYRTSHPAPREPLETKVDYWNG